MDKRNINLEHIRVYDEWEESDHPRAENGQFTSGSGSNKGISPLKEAAANLNTGSKTSALKKLKELSGADINSSDLSPKAKKGAPSSNLKQAKPIETFRHQAISTKVEHELFDALTRVAWELNQCGGRQNKKFRSDYNLYLETGKPKFAYDAAMYAYSLNGDGRLYKKAQAFKAFIDEYNKQNEK